MAPSCHGGPGYPSARAKYGSRLQSELGKLSQAAAAGTEIVLGFFYLREGRQAAKLYARLEAESAADLAKCLVEAFQDEIAEPDFEFKGI